MDGWVDGWMGGWMDGWIIGGHSVRVTQAFPRMRFSGPLDLMESATSVMWSFHSIQLTSSLSWLCHC